jgi:hypothetical protein
MAVGKAPGAPVYASDMEEKCVAMARKSALCDRLARSW